MDYADFLAAKRWKAPASGYDCTADDVAADLFDFQAHITAWALRRGRAAIWTDTGTGKTRMQVRWLEYLAARGVRGLLLAPLGVTAQTVREAAAIGVPIAYAHNQTEIAGPITITNYDRLHLFDPATFGAVVLDESSILKAYSGVTKRALVAAFRNTPYRLACTATPAPNDIEELCNHADFLGVMTPQEMRSTFFIADSRGEFMKYRMKGHAKRAFYEWLADWAMACRSPADLGFDGSAYVLPPLNITDHLIATDGWTAEGELFTTALKGVTHRAQIRRDTVSDRVAAAVRLIHAESAEQWLVWCGRNDEAAGVAAAIAGAVNIQGSDTAEVKADALADFAAGRVRVLITKPTIAGYGMNFQRCARQVFVGLGDSYELYYQGIRRCWRFGQDRPVEVHIILTDLERAIAANVRAKERRAQEVTGGLVAAVAEHNRRELFAGTSAGDDYEPRRPMVRPEWLETAT
jgi:hypothetical protein